MLVPPADPGALATALARALDDPGLRARLGAAGRERVLKEFTWRATAEGTVGQYRALLEAHRRFPPTGVDGRQPRLRRRWTRPNAEIVPAGGIARDGDDRRPKSGR
jgi:hypothetical protein